MRNKNRTRWSVLIFAILMSLIMVGSLATGWILQFAQQRDLRRQQEQALEPTAIPTFEPPIATGSIILSSDALQGNGVFTVGIPEPPEWGAIESSYDSFANRARLLLRDDRNVVEATAETPREPVATTQDLDAYYDAQVLGTSWRNYSNWTETQREFITGADGREYLQIDFEVEFNQRSYVARQRAWTDGERIYGVRVVTPGNATDLLVFLLDMVAESYQPISAYEDVPIAWNAYYDPALEHMIRYPQAWSLTDSAEGAPASIEAQNIALRVETIAGETAADAGAAEAYTEGLPNVTEVLSVEETERDGLAGFEVAYQTQNLDGETGSGLVTLLNGDDVLHVANLTVTGIAVDLNVAEADTEDPDISQAQLDEIQLVLDTFHPMSGVQYAAPAAASGAPIVENAGTGQQPVNLGF